MKLSEMVKPTTNDLPLQIHGMDFTTRNTFGGGNQTPLPDDSDELDIQFIQQGEREVPVEVQMIAAVDYIRQLKAVVDFMLLNADRHDILGVKSLEATRDLSNEVEDFLGEYVN